MKTPKFYERNHRYGKTRLSVVKNIFVPSWFVYRDIKHYRVKIIDKMGLGENDRKQGPSCQLVPGGFAGTGPNGSFFETPGWVDKVRHPIQVFKASACVRTRLRAWPPRPRQWHPLAGGSSWSQATSSSSALTWSGSPSPWLTTFCFPTIMRRQKALQIFTGYFKGANKKWIPT